MHKALTFLIAVLLIGFASWQPISPSNPASMRISQGTSFRPAGIIFSPATLTLRSGQRATVAVSLDTSGIPVSLADLRFKVSDSSLIALPTVQPDGLCAPSLPEPLALRCQIQENAAREQLVPIGNLSLQAAGQPGEAVITVQPNSQIISPTLSGIDRLRYAPILTIHIAP